MVLGVGVASGNRILAGPSLESSSLPRGHMIFFVFLFLFLVLKGFFLKKNSKIQLGVGFSPLKCMQPHLQPVV
jgi:hypothetical protein